MLEWMRNQAGSLMIKLLLGAIALAFALSFGLYNYGDGPQQAALKVNGEPVSAQRLDQEYQRQYDEAKSRFGQMFDQIQPALKLKEQAQQTVILQVLMQQQVRKLGVPVDDAELQASIQSIEGFHKDGKFDLDTYQRALAREGMTAAQFEEQMATNLALGKLYAIVSSGAQVGQTELEQYLQFTESSIQAVYLGFKPQDFADKVQASDDEVKAFYDKSPGLFMEPPKMAFQYLTFPLADYRDQVEVTNQDVVDVYEANRSQFSRPEQVHARHILIRVAPDAPEAEAAQAEAKAREIMEKAKAGADFAQLAKDNSQGPTAENGGDLGWFGRGQMVGPFEDLAFKLEPGQVDVVRTQFGWHVIKVEEKRPAEIVPLEEVRKPLEEQLRERGTMERAAAAAENAFDRLANGETLDKLATELKKTAGQTGLVAPGQEVPELAGLGDVFGAAQDVQVGQPLPVMPYAGGSLLAVLTERQDEKLKPFDEVKDQARQALLSQKADQAAKEAAAALLAELAKDPKPGYTLAGKAGSVKTDWLRWQGQIQGVAGSQGMVEALFSVPVEQPVLADPVEMGGVYYAAAVSDRKAPTAQELEPKREGARELLLSQKRRAMWEAWVTDLQAKAEILVEGQQP